MSPHIRPTDAGPERVREDATLSDADQRARFEHSFRTHARAILGYALRRTTPADAADVVAETFVVAWRRVGEMPTEPETRLWLFGVARRVLANQHRGTRRRMRLSDRLRSELVPLATQSEPTLDSDRVRRVADSLGGLRDVEREVLMLTAVEGLTPSQIAVALELPAATVRTHLHRGRLKLRSTAGAAMPSERTEINGAH